MVCSSGTMTDGTESSTERLLLTQLPPNLMLARPAGSASHPTWSEDMVAVSETDQMSVGTSISTR